MCVCSSASSSRATELLCLFVISARQFILPHVNSLGKKKCVCVGGGGGEMRGKERSVIVSYRSVNRTGSPQVEKEL